jgi:hypothetical protein
MISPSKACAEPAMELMNFRLIIALNSPCPQDLKRYTGIPVIWTDPKIWSDFKNITQ